MSDIPPISITVTDQDADMRLDRMLRKRFPGLTQGVIEKALRTGKIRIDSTRIKASYRLKADEMITLPVAIAEHSKAALATPQKLSAKPASKALIATLRGAVISQTDDYIAINKPSGLAVQGGTGTSEHVDGGIAAAFPDGKKPLLVHRLDRDTSGVLVLAKHGRAARQLAKGFQSRHHGKIYLALVAGRPKELAGVIKAPLIKSGSHGNEKMVVDDMRGDHAETIFECLDSIGGKVSLMQLEPLTGRTHQLRAHMIALGCPILGDGKYGGADAFPNAQVTRLCLHAARLDLADEPPIIADLPHDLAAIMTFFDFDPLAVMDMIRHK